MTTRTLLNSLFHHKASIDEELLDALASLTGTEASENFGAALRILHHAHIVDRIFAANLEARPHDYKASWTRQAPALADLAARMKETDRWYLDYVADIEPAALEEMIDFTFTDGGRGRMSREEMLAHVVTHSGYHRGEAGRLLPEIENTAMRDVFAGYLHRREPQRRQ